MTSTPRMPLSADDSRDGAPDTPVAGRDRGPVPLGVGAAADLIAVLLFVILGRRAHDEGSVITGTAATAWPFLAGTATGWVVLLSRRVGPASVRGGIAIVLATVAVGMTLRHLTGGGVQASFVAVATTVLGVLLLGWRALAGRRR